MSLENERLKELEAYGLLDTPPEKELDELAEIASLICNTPISLITLVDKDRQWFKANKGLNINETPRKDAFCQHALHKPKEVLVVNDSLKDARFEKNPLVTGNPNIRFYAGAPLETPDGNVLGTLCVIDNKPRNLSENQKKALQILARKAMDYLNIRKIVLDQRNKVELSAKRLRKLTNNVPGGIFQLTMNTEGDMKFDFLSEGIKQLHPEIDIKEWLKDPKVGFSVIHPDDLEPFQESLNKSFQNLSLWHQEYRVVSGDDYKWHVVKAKPKKLEDGSVVWYGSFQNITNEIEYELAMQQISFDISHVLRRPVSTLLGLTSIIENEENMSKIDFKNYSRHIQTVAEEMDDFTRKLNEIYQRKKDKASFHSSRYQKSS